jgi:hypothetical protein
MARQAQFTAQLISKLELNELGNDSSPIIDLRVHSPNDKIPLIKKPLEISSSTLGSDISPSERMRKVL